MNCITPQLTGIQLWQYFTGNWVPTILSRAIARARSRGRAPGAELGAAVINALVAPQRASELKKRHHAPAWRNRRKIGRMFHETIYAVMTCAPKKFRKLPSAARFFPKRFRGFDFWTYFLCPFLKNFSSLVQIRIENNKKIFLKYHLFFVSIMQRLKKGTKNAKKSAQKKLKKKHQNM